MLTRELDFDLPSELIAQTPVEPRDAARLLVLNRATGAVSHRFVRDLPALLRAGDLLVLNDTRVLRARACAAPNPAAGASKPSCSKNAAATLGKPCLQTCGAPPSRRRVVVWRQRFRTRRGARAFTRTQR